MNTLDMTGETNFGCPLQLCSTSFRTMRAMKVVVPGGEKMLDASNVIVMAAPAAMLRAGRRNDGSNTRHGWMRNGNEMVGLSMAYIDRHFAVAIYDLGEPQAQEMARLALAEDCTRFMLCHGDEEVLVTPSLTADCRMAYEEAQVARPASFASFMRATASLTQSFTLAETFSGMGLDPDLLRSVSVSVCLPQPTEACTVQVMEAKELRSKTCH